MELRSHAPSIPTMIKMEQPIQRGASHVQQDISASMQALPTTKTIPVLRDHFAQMQPEKLYHVHLEPSEKILVQLLRMIAVCVLLDITAPTKMEPSQKSNVQRVISAQLDLKTRHCVPQGSIATVQRLLTLAILATFALQDQDTHCYAKWDIIAPLGMKTISALVL